MVAVQILEPQKPSIGFQPHHSHHTVSDGAKVNQFSFVVKENKTIGTPGLHTKSHSQTIHKVELVEDSCQ